MIERDGLAENARKLGEWLKGELQRLANVYPTVLRSARGLGFMLGVELADKGTIPAFAASDKPASTQLAHRLHEAGLLTIPSGNQVLRLLPPLNLARAQAEEGLTILERVVRGLA